MKAKEALKLLNVTRVSLYKYVKDGKIKVTLLANGYYDYDDQSVFDFLGKSKRSNVIYARVSTNKQKPDLANQISSLSSYCKSNNIKVASILSDVSSGLDLNRPSFSSLLNDIFRFKIACVVVSYKDRLTRLSFSILESIFKHFGTSIIVANKSDSSFDEYYDDLLTLMHSFSTKFYSKRKNLNSNTNLVKPKIINSKKNIIV